MEELAQLLERVVTDHRDADWPRGTTGPVALDRRLWAALAGLGLTRLTGPEHDAGWAAGAVLLRAAGAGAIAAPVAENDLLAGWLLRDSEPAAVRTAAVLDTHGAARRVPWARDADELVVLWPADGTWRVAALPRDEVELTEAVNYASEPRDDIRVAIDRLTGTVVPSSVVAEFQRRGALARALMMSGAMRRVRTLVVEHTTTRVQFGRPIAKFQAVQHMVADLTAQTALVDAACDAAVTVADDGLDTPRAGFAVAAAKSCAGHAASTVGRIAHQCLGAIGFTLEHELHRHTTRLLSWRSEYGTTRHWDDVLTAAAADAGTDGLWPLIADGWHHRG